MLYLIHFDTPYKHARHYLGFVRRVADLDARIERHRNGTGARLMEVIKSAGISWQVVRTWPEGDRTKERQMKNRGHLPDYCPVCRAQNRELSTSSERTETTEHR